MLYAVRFVGTDEWLGYGPTVLRGARVYRNLPQAKACATRYRQRCEVGGRQVRPVEIVAFAPSHVVT